MPKLTSSKWLTIRKSIDIAIATAVVLIVVATTAISAKTQLSSSNLQSAQVVELLGYTEDGGYIYQNVQVQVGQLTTDIRFQIRDKQLEALSAGDQIYLDVRETASGTFYSFVAHKRSSNLLWYSLIFLCLLVVMLGVKGIKYIYPSLLIMIAISTGVLTYLLTNFNIYLISLTLLIAVSFIANLLQFKDIKLASVVSLANLVTLTLVLLLNLALFRINFLTDLYYTDSYRSQLTIFEFWALLNSVIIYIAFGVSTNTALDVAKRVIAKKKKFPRTALAKLIREGTEENQIASARVINGLFFLFLGLILINIVTGLNSTKLFIWDDPEIIRNVILFMNASIAALLVGPITSIVTAIVVALRDRNLPEVKFSK